MANLKRVGDRKRILILARLCVYFDDEGALRSPQIARKLGRSHSTGLITG
jgi:hypothetical protein